MAHRVRNIDWKDDEKLKQELSAYVSQGLKREEILDFVKRDYQEYTWSFRTLDRRLRAFDIYYTDKGISVEQIQDAVRKELDGPGQLLGYRAMQNKLRQEHGLNVPRDLVHDVMYDLDEEGLAARRPCRKQKKNRGHFTTKGVNWVFSLDGHDKLMGYQNSTFPLAVYGCLDTASRKLRPMELRYQFTVTRPRGSSAPASNFHYFKFFSLLQNFQSKVFHKTVICVKTIIKVLRLFEISLNS